MAQISYPGIPGSYSYRTAVNYFGKGNVFVGTREFEEIATNIIENETDFGVLPIENSIVGPIQANIDLLKKYQLKKIDEYILPIGHCLLSKLSSIEMISKVYSHPVALAQCSIFFSKYPNIKLIEFTDTASSAELVSKSKELGLGAIASKECAKLFKLNILSEKVQDQEDNWTKFAILRK